MDDAHSPTETLLHQEQTVRALVQAQKLRERLAKVEGAAARSNA